MNPQVHWTHIIPEALMDKLKGINKSSRRTILMVTHDPNAASFCSRILFIQDGVIFHELRRKHDESQENFYERILQLLAQLGGGSAKCSLGWFIVMRNEVVKKI